MQKLHKKLKECDKGPVWTVKDIIDLEVRGLDQEKAPRDSLVECNIAAGECDRVRAELTRRRRASHRSELH